MAITAVDASGWNNVHFVRVFKRGGERLVALVYFGWLVVLYVIDYNVRRKQRDLI